MYPLQWLSHRRIHTIFFTSKRSSLCFKKNSERRSSYGTNWKSFWGVSSAKETSHSNFKEALAVCGWRRAKFQVQKLCWEISDKERKLCAEQKRPLKTLPWLFLSLENCLLWYLENIVKRYLHFHYIKIDTSFIRNQQLTRNKLNKNRFIFFYISYFLVWIWALKSSEQDIMFSSEQFPVILIVLLKV